MVRKLYPTCPKSVLNFTITMPCLRQTRKTIPVLYSYREFKMATVQVFSVKCLRSVLMIIANNRASNKIWFVNCLTETSEKLLKVFLLYYVTENLMKCFSFYLKNIELYTHLIIDTHMMGVILSPDKIEAYYKFEAFLCLSVCLWPCSYETSFPISMIFFIRNRIPCSDVIHHLWTPILKGSRSKLPFEF